MQLSLRLERLSGTVVECPDIESDPTLDSIVSLFAELCECLEENRAVEFVVSGFGQERWPVDVSTDLPVVLEQMPELCAGVGSGNRVIELEFYEQGVERRLRFLPKGDWLEIECTSMTDWAPHPEIIRHPRSEIIEMLRSFGNTFLQLVAEAAPGLLVHPLFISWRRQVESP